MRREGPRDRSADAHSTIWGLAADPASPLPRPPGTGARRHSVNRRKSQIAAGCRRREAMSAIGQLIHAGSLSFGSPARIRFCSSAVKFAPPGNDRAALSHNLREGPRREIDRLVQRREGGGNDQHVLLHEGLAGLTTAWRPDAVLAGLFADREALGRVLVRPDVAPAVEPKHIGTSRGRSSSRCTK